jgi:hypothetical protein
MRGSEEDGKGGREVVRRRMEKEREAVRKRMERNLFLLPLPPTHCLSPSFLSILLTTSPSFLSIHFFSQSSSLFFSLLPLSHPRRR